MLIPFSSRYYSIIAVDELIEYNKVKGSLLGEEMSFVGQVRSNALYNTTELTIQEIKKINPQDLIKELGTKN